MCNAGFSGTSRQIGASRGFTFFFLLLLEFKRRYKVSRVALNFSGLCYTLKSKDCRAIVHLVNKLLMIGIVCSYLNAACFVTQVKCRPHKRGVSAVFLIRRHTIL